MKTKAIVLGILLLLSRPLDAIIMMPLSIEELTAKSEAVVRGTVASKACQRDAAGRIYTKVELQVTEVWKGELASHRLTVVHGGGILGQERVEIPGQVEYQMGEEVVAFIVFNQRKEAVTLGLAQGKFHVWKDPTRGTLLVRNPFHGGAATASPQQIASSSGSQSLTAADRPRIQGSLTLAELRDQVKGGRK